MNDEVLDVINKNNQVIGQEMKSVVHQKGLKHRVSAVLLRREDGKYLITTAANHKVDAGGLYHSAAGHVLSGKTYLEGAIKEFEEELNLNASGTVFEFLGSFWFEHKYPTRIEKERFEVFRLQYHKSMGVITLNNEHINEQWLSEEELKDIYINHPGKLSWPLRFSCKHIFGF